MSAFTLARWFTESREADELQREELLSDLYGPRVVAVREHQLIVRTDRQTCIIEETDYRGSLLVTFDSCENGRWVRVTFWYNLSSVQDLLEELRGEASKDPQAFEILFFGVRPG